MNDTGLAVLVSYAYAKKHLLDCIASVPKQDRSLLFDSGAFTAYTSGASITLDDYCAFLDTLERLRPFHAIQLDVIGDPDASFEAAVTMKQRGFDVLPVHTRGGTLDQIEHLYEEWDYVAFGGLKSAGQKRPYVKWLMEQVGTRQAHWLGLTDTALVKAYQPTSVDCSTHAAAARYRNLVVYDGKLDAYQIARTEFATRPKQQVLAWLRDAGFAWSRIALLGQQRAWKINRRAEYFVNGVTREPDDAHTAILISNCSSIRRGIEIEKRFGTKVYQALSNAAGAEFMFNAFYWGRKQSMW